MTNEEKVKYIIEHINDRPRSAVAKAAGVSLSTLYRIVRENGGEINHALSERHPEWWDDYIREHYPYESALDIAKSIGAIKNRVNKIARERGVTHSEEFKVQQKAQQIANLKKSQYKIDRAAASAKWKHTRHIDELRIDYGLRPKTKFRFKQMPQKMYKVVWYLTSRYNYVKDDSHKYTLRYHDDTNRVCESYYISKYGLKFQQL